MKLPFLPKTACIIGFMAALSAIVGSSIASSVQAQPQPPAQSQPTEAEMAAETLRVTEQSNRERVEKSWVRAVPDFCPAVTKYMGTADPSGLPPLFFDDEGNVRSWDFAGLESALTPEILAVYDQAEKRLSDRGRTLNEELETRVNPKAYIQVVPKEGLSSADAIIIEISTAVDTVNADEITNGEQLAALVKKYGQYANFPGTDEPVYTPAQILEDQSIEREFAATMAAAFTNPEQREYYLKNVDAREAIKSCYPKALLAETNRPTASTTTPTSTGSTSQSQDIVVTAISNGSFDTLVAAVQAAGLVDTLNAEGPYTVFAPTDEAFAALPAGVFDKLLLPKNKAVLAKILTYHVIAGNIPASAVRTGPAPSVEGANLNLTASGGKVTVNGVNVVQADVATSNGVIHVIDAVLLPPDLDLSKL